MNTDLCIWSRTGDGYAGQWVVEAVSKEGITYRHSEQTKSELYTEALPSFTTGATDLLDYQPPDD